MYDNINTLDEVTNRLEDAKLILQSVCDNYFGYNEKGTDPTILHSQYNVFSSLVHCAKNMIWDIEKEYRDLSETLLAEWKAHKPKDEPREYSPDFVKDIATSACVKGTVLLTHPSNDQGYRPGPARKREV